MVVYRNVNIGKNDGGGLIFPAQKIPANYVQFGSINRRTLLQVSGINHLNLNLNFPLTTEFDPVLDFRISTIISTFYDSSGIPTDAYYAIEEVHDDGTPTSKTFNHVASEIGAEEAEEVGVEHLLRDIRDTTIGSLSQSVNSQLQSVKGLMGHTQHIELYLAKVS